MTRPVYGVFSLVNPSRHFVIQGIQQSITQHYASVARSTRKEITAAPAPAEDKTQGEYAAASQAQIKLQQAMRVYQGLDEAEVMQDVR